jgi:hypothetical protein
MIGKALGWGYIPKTRGWTQLSPCLEGPYFRNALILCLYFRLSMFPIDINFKFIVFPIWLSLEEGSGDQNKMKKILRLHEETL